MRALERPAAIRQTLLASFDQCPLSTRFALESGLRQPSWLAARGTLAHRFFAEAMEHMRAHGERSIPVEVAMELLQGVVAQRDVPAEEVVHLPMREIRWLRVLATKFAYGHEFSIERVVSVEQRYSAPIEVVGPGGTHYEREVSGQLDVLQASPPDGAVVIDYKTGWSPAPRAYEDEAGQVRTDRLSDMGFAQQIIYGYLVLANFPAVHWVALREYYVMSGEVREARVERWEMERIRDVLAALVSQLDAAIDEGPESERWFPVPGTHCAMCRRPRECPIREEVGIPASYVEAQRLVQEWHVAGEVRKERAPLVKGWVGREGEVALPHSKGRRVVGFRNGSRSLAVYAPEAAPESPFDPLLEEAAREAGTLAEVPAG